MDENEKTYLISRDKLLSGIIEPAGDSVSGAQAAQQNGAHREGLESDPYAQLAESCEWHELKKRTESVLGSGASDENRARLWWLYAQLHLGQVPLSILAGSIDECTESIMNANEGGGALKSLSARVLEKAGEELATEKQFELSAHFLSRAAEVSPEAASKKVSVLKEEKEALQALPSYTLSDKEKEKLLEGDVPGEKDDSKEVSRDRPRRLLSLFLVAGITLGMLYLVRKNFGREISSYLFEPEAELQLVLNEKEQKAQLQLPPLERADGTALDGLRYEIDNIFSKQSPAPAPQGRAQRAPLEAKRSVPVDAGEESVSQKVIESEKEAIDVSGPLEPENFPVAEVGSGDSTEKSSDTDSGLVVRRDFVREFPGASQGGSSGRVAFPAKYEVIARSEVRASPSYHAAILKELQIGDRVEVIKEEAPWFIVRSRKGNTGYVLSQDLAEVK